MIYRSKLKGHSAVIAHAVRVRLGSWERVGSSPTFGAKFDSGNAFATTAPSPHNEGATEMTRLSFPWQEKKLPLLKILSQTESKLVN